MRNVDDALGELLRDTSDHILLLTATPHKGAPDGLPCLLEPSVLGNFTPAAPLPELPAAAHVELSLTELLQHADDEIGRASEDKDKGVTGADGRLAEDRPL